MPENSKNDIAELSEKVLGGVRKALRKLVETNAANNEEMVLGDKDGNVKTIPAKDLLARLQNQPQGPSFLGLLFFNLLAVLPASSLYGSL
jgi:hypothetical protein